MDGNMDVDTYVKTLVDASATMAVLTLRISALSNQTTLSL
jgi:hypothetical protein